MQKCPKLVMIQYSRTARVAGDRGRWGGGIKKLGNRPDFGRLVQTLFQSGLAPDEPCDEQHWRTHLRYTRLVHIFTLQAYNT